MAISHLQALATSTPRLRSLDLSDVCLRGRSIAAAATLTALTHLRLGTPHVSTLHDMPCLSQLTRLGTLHLDLSGCELQVCSDAAFLSVLRSTEWLQEIGPGLYACVFYCGRWLCVAWSVIGAYAPSGE